MYVQKVSPQKTPQVIGKLLDLEAPEESIRNLLNAVGQMCPAAELVEQVGTDPSPVRLPVVRPYSLCV